MEYGTGSFKTTPRTGGSNGRAISMLMAHITYPKHGLHGSANCVSRANNLETGMHYAFCFRQDSQHLYFPAAETP